MKQLLILLCSFSFDFIMAQDCTQHALMQKGAQLEYKLYSPKPDSSNNMTGRAISRMLYEVEQVKDSAGSIWSTISKKGFGMHYKHHHYERKIVLQCDGRNLLIPFDFFGCDTLYAKDLWPDIEKYDNGWSYGCQPLDNAITYIVPLVMDCITGLPEGQKKVVQITQKGYTAYTTFKKVDYYTRAYNIKNIKLDGKEWVTTPAGSFYCYKFCMEFTVDDYTEPEVSWLYFNSVVGLVKEEEYRRCVELINIRK
jgi:hypothetical protein